MPRIAYHCYFGGRAATATFHPSIQEKVTIRNRRGRSEKLHFMRESVK